MNMDDLNIDDSNEDLTDIPATEEDKVDYKTKFSKSASEAQRLLKQKKELESKNSFNEKILEGIGQVVKNGDAHVLEIAGNDPEVAQAILNKYYDGITLEEFEEKMTGKKPEINPEKLKKQIREEVEENYKQEEVKKSIRKFIKNAGFDEDTLEKFKENLNDITEGKRLNPDNIQKYLKISFAETVGYDKKDNTETVAKIMSAGGTSSGGDKQKTNDELLLDDMNKTMSERLGIK